VEAAGLDEAGPLARALADAGLSLAEGAGLRVVATRDYLDPALDGVAARGRRLGFAWLPVKLSGPSCWIGPLMQPGAGACWTCLTHRLRHNRPDRTFVQRRLGAAAPPSAPTALAGHAFEAGARLVALELARVVLAEAPADAPQRLLAFDYGQLRTSEHPVTRRPQCPVCGDGELVRRRALARVALESRAKSAEDDGGYRCVGPEATFERLRGQISPITGVVTHVAPVPGRDHPLRPVYSSAYFACPSHDDPGVGEFGRPSLGKGRTAAQARAGALAEAIERYSAAFQGDEATVRARRSELDGAAVHPDDLQGFSDAQYRRREAINAGAKELRKMVPLRFDESVAIDWTPAWSLTFERRRYVPTSYCYLHTPGDSGSAFCSFNPNGHAAGNCVEEAVLQAFLELVERDAIALWWYSRAARPEVATETFDEPYFESLRRHYRSMGHRTWVLDLTTDLEIPAFAALSRSDDGARWCIGFGCHLDPRLGVQRALTELNQLFDPAGEARAPWNDAAVTDRSYLLPDEAIAPRRAEDFRHVARDDLRDDVLLCVDRARRLGLETIVLDQTRPDVGLSAAKVIVPGLRHIWPRLGPGRLYDAPVKLGWLERPLREDELNPVHLFL